MEKTLIVSNTIVINASMDAVWDALTNPDQTQKYMFGCRTISDWKPGSPLLWNFTVDGQEVTAVKGKIIDIKPGLFLAYTTIDPNAALADIDENYLRVTYSLSEKDGQTVLTASQGDFARVGDGEKRYAETIAGGGWEPILVAIKNLLEK